MNFLHEPSAIVFLGIALLIGVMLGAFVVAACVLAARADSQSRQGWKAEL